MDFGPAVTPAPDGTPAAWIPPRQDVPTGLHDPWGVGYFVPSGFERCLFVDDVAEEDDGDWWTVEQAHTEVIAEIAARHTSTPDRAWFAVWEGHGYPTSGLQSIPMFANGDRTRDYYLLHGPVAAVLDIVTPGRPSGGWRQPDLWWPEDRAWIVCTDVDLWCQYVAGTAELVAEVAEAVRTESHLVDRSDPLERVD